jgi:hypothetical protein
MNIISTVISTFAAWRCLCAQGPVWARSRLGLERCFCEDILMFLLLMRPLCQNWAACVMIFVGFT